MRKTDTAFSWGQITFSTGVTPQENAVGLKAKFGLLAVPHAICLSGTNGFDNSRSVFNELEMDVSYTQTVEDFSTEVGATSAYQPTVCLLDSAILNTVSIENVCNLFAKHLSYSILLYRAQVSTGTENRRPHPSLPIEFMSMPVDLFALRSKLDQFLIQASHLADYLMKMKRLENLDERERILVQLISYGMPNKKSANILGIAEKTVEKCRSGIYRKLGVRSTGALASLITMSTFYRWPLGVDFPSKNVG